MAPNDPNASDTKASHDKGEARRVAVTAAAVGAVLLAGSAAMAANLGLFRSEGPGEVGRLDLAGVSSEQSSTSASSTSLPAQGSATTTTVVGQGSAPTAAPGGPPPRPPGDDDHDEPWELDDDGGEHREPWEHEGGDDDD